MTVKRPETYKETRIVNKRKASLTEIPSLSLTVNADNLYTGIYKGEIAINDYTPNNVVVSSAGIYIRVGGSESELATDKLVRIGPAYVTSDAGVNDVEVGIVAATLAANRTTLDISGALVNQLQPNQRIYTLTAAGVVKGEATITGFNIISMGLQAASGNWAAGQRLLTSRVDTVNTYTAGSIAGAATITTTSNSRRLKENSVIFSINNASATISAISSQGTQRIYSLSNVSGNWSVGSPILMDSIGTIISYSGNTLIANLSVPHPTIYSGLQLYATTNSVPQVLGEGTINSILVEVLNLSNISGSFTKDDKVYIKPRPTIHNINNKDLIRTGEIWLRGTDGAVFINNGVEWQRVTPVAATQELSGLIEIANQLEVDSGQDNNRAITPLTLNTWKTNKKLIQEKDPFFSIYVDSYTGSDFIENDGTDPYRPFKTIERALLEVARRSYVAGVSNDHYAKTTVYIAAGEYTIDNRPGAAEVTDITTMSATGIIDPLQIGTITTAYDVNTKRVGINVTELGEIEVNKQIFSVNTNNVVVGSCVIQSLSTTNGEYTVGQLQGSWVPALKVVVPQYRLYNAVDSGVIVPRGCSLIGSDLTKTRIKPKYVGNVALWQQDNICQAPGRASILKVTGGCLIESLTFIDNELITQPGLNSSLVESHHLCTSIEFVSTLELPVYYTKIVKGLGNTVTPNMVAGELQEATEENTIVTATTAAVDVDNVKGTAPYINNCSLLSKYGLNGVLVDGAKVLGFKSMNALHFTQVSLQTDSRALNDAAVSSSYKEEWRHYAFKAINNGYIKVGSCNTVGQAAHYLVEEGGEIAVTNSSSSYGDISLLAKGYSNVVLPQDTGAIVTHIVPAKSASTAAAHQKLYWLKVTGLDVLTKRRPKEGFIIKFTSTFGSSLSNILFTALTRDKDLTGASLANGVYYIALLSADGDVNEAVENIYPSGAVNLGLTYYSTLKFLVASGLTNTEATTLLTASTQTGNDEKSLTPNIPCEFYSPSLIRSVGHTWEWAGYGNYSDGLPKFQTTFLSEEDSKLKMKKQSKGGRVFCSGMDQDGNFFIGNKIYDLKDSTES